VLTVDANVWVAALDEDDAMHASSLRFLETVRDRGISLLGPGLLLVETACAVARRRDDAEAALSAAATLRRLTALRLSAHDADLEAGALELGVRLRLRGADSYYVAVAARERAPLITWDTELIDRAAGQTPVEWLAENL
jgi:predicted nucleic acid-binding protein